MLFNVWEDPNESTDLAADNPEKVAELQAMLDERLALHPVGGSLVRISPHPGWRAPIDYAENVIPADKVHSEGHKGFGPLKSKVLQQRYGERGRILYD